MYSGAAQLVPTVPHWFKREAYRTVGGDLTSECTCFVTQLIEEKYYIACWDTVYKARVHVLRVS